MSAEYDREAHLEEQVINLTRANETLSAANSTLTIENTTLRNRLDIQKEANETLSARYLAVCDERDTLRAELAAVRGELAEKSRLFAMNRSESESRLEKITGLANMLHSKSESIVRLTEEGAELRQERDRLREAVEWQPITESTLPERHRPVALLDINRFQNCHFELNVQDVGYLEGEAPMFYWAIRGERAQEIHAFTHWKYLGAPPTHPQPDDQPKSAEVGV